MSIKIMYCNESQKLLSQQLLFEVSLFMFNFISALHYNEYQVKQIVSPHLKLPLELAFLQCVFATFAFGNISLCLS